MHITSRKVTVRHVVMVPHLGCVHTVGLRRLTALEISFRFRERAVKPLLLD